MSDCHRYAALINAISILVQFQNRPADYMNR